MNITLAQFRQIAPAATAATVDALFVPGHDKQPVIHRALAEHRIIEPPVVVMFLALCSLASDRFTNFNEPQYGAGAAEWLHRMAREFYGHKLVEDALEWDWLTVADTFPEKGFAWLEAHNRLSEVCAALGVEDRADEMALLEDRWPVV